MKCSLSFGEKIAVLYFFSFPNVQNTLLYKAFFKKIKKGHKSPLEFNQLILIQNLP
jgi:hypothetical protein